YIDPQTRSNRIEKENNHWSTQMDVLVEAYLDYRYCDSEDGMPHIDGMPGSPSDHDVYHGYLGCTPLYPTVAISLRTLAAYHQMHRVCPMFSFQALCFLNEVTTFNVHVYLQILQCVNQCLCIALKRNTPNWHLLNACPVCFYKVEDEPNLDFEWLVTMDGNNSLKRWDSAIYRTNARLDSHKVQSDFWIDPNTVDKFSGEVR
ncbi:hypothetical protein BDR05DRAFT_865585, partial [Suillus weaverae]